MCRRTEMLELSDLELNFGRQSTEIIVPIWEVEV
jgi:hypothetical protein